jgi:hypothetical protein
MLVIPPGTFPAVHGAERFGQHGTWRCRAHVTDGITGMPLSTDEM